jgi:uncharacterized membrane protein
VATGLHVSTAESFGLVHVASCMSKQCRLLCGPATFVTVRVLAARACRRAYQVLCKRLVARIGGHFSDSVAILEMNCLGTPARAVHVPCCHGISRRPSRTRCRLERSVCSWAQQQDEATRSEAGVEEREEQDLWQVSAQSAVSPAAEATMPFVFLLAVATFGLALTGAQTCLHDTRWELCVSFTAGLRSHLSLTIATTLRSIAVIVAALGSTSACCAGYLLWSKLTSSEVLCPVGGCSSILSSPYAQIGPVPLPALGMFGYGSVAAASATAATQARQQGVGGTSQGLALSHRAILAGTMPCAIARLMWLSGGKQSLSRQAAV